MPPPVTPTNVPAGKTIPLPPALKKETLAQAVLRTSKKITSNPLVKGVAKGVSMAVGAPALDVESIKKSAPFIEKATDYAFPLLRPFIKGVSTGDYTDFHKVNDGIQSKRKDISDANRRIVSTFNTKDNASQSDWDKVADDTTNLVLSFDGGFLGAESKKFAEEAKSELVPRLKEFVESKSRLGGTVKSADELAPKISTLTDPLRTETKPVVRFKGEIIGDPNVDVKLTTKQKPLADQQDNFLQALSGHSSPINAEKKGVIKIEGNIFRDAFNPGKTYKVTDYLDWLNANAKNVVKTMETGDMPAIVDSVAPVIDERIANLKEIAKTHKTKEDFIKDQVDAHAQGLGELQVLKQWNDEAMNPDSYAHPGKVLQKYIDPHTGRLPEIGVLTKSEKKALIKKENKALANGKGISSVRNYKANYDTILQDSSLIDFQSEATGTHGVKSHDDWIQDYRKLKAKDRGLRSDILELKRNKPNPKDLAKLYDEVHGVQAQEKAISQKLKPAEVKATPFTNKSMGELRSIELQGERYSNPEYDPFKHKDVPPLAEIITQDKKYADKKMNILDYLGTPEYVLKKIGFGKQYTALRQAYEGYAKELPQNLSKIAKWAKSVPPESNIRIFKYLDGQAIDLTTAEHKVATEVKDWLKVWAKRLNLTSDGQLSHYITHIFEDSIKAKDFPDELSRIMTDKIPGQVYDPFLEKRLGAKGYKQDTWGALDAYVKRATRKVHMDPALDMVKHKAGSSMENSNIETSQYKYLTSYINGINMRPTDVDNLVDNAVKSTFGGKFGNRPVARLSSALRRWTNRGLIGLNPANFLRNLSQGVNTYAVLGEKYTPLGYMKLLSSANREEVKQSGVLAENFVQDRSINAIKTKMQKLDSVLFKHIEVGEMINRGAAYLGAKSKALAKGMTEQDAIEYAKSIVRKTQFSFTPVDMPVAMQNDIVKTIAQFQGYTLKQAEFLGGLIKDKNFAGLLRYAIGGYMWLHTIGKVYGMDWKEMLPLSNYRFDAPPSLKLPVEVTKAALGTKDKYGNTPTTSQKLQSIGNAAVGLIPAGNQIRKTYHGIKAVQDGGVPNAKGKLKFKQGKSSSAKLQSILFGPNVSPEAKAYYNRKDKKKTTKLKPI